MFHLRNFTIEIYKKHKPKLPSACLNNFFCQYTEVLVCKLVFFVNSVGPTFSFC